MLMPAKDRKNDNKLNSQTPSRGLKYELTACACAQLKEQHAYAWLGVVCRNVLIKVKLVQTAIWEPLSQLLRKCTSEGFDLSKPAQIRT